MNAHATRFDSLDVLRGIACLVVAVMHIHNLKLNFGPHILIEMFMVLSGFVLAHSYLYRPGRERIGICDFIWRRFARMWPLHAFTLFWMYGVVIYSIYGQFWLYPENNNWWTLTTNLLLSHNIGLPPNGEYFFSWNMPSWSVSVEFWVNIGFILLVFRKTPSWAMFLFTGLCMWVLWTEMGTLYTYNENIYGWLNSGLLRGLSAFPLGIVAYRAYLYIRDWTWPAWLATLVEVAVLWVLYFMLFAKQHGYRELEVLSPLLFLVMIPIFALERGWISRGTRWAAYVGTISFSIYLNHMWVLIAVNNSEWIKEHMSAELIKPTILVITLFVSAVTYELIEIPGQRLMNRFNPFRKKPAPKVAA